MQLPRLRFTASIASSSQSAAAAAAAVMSAALTVCMRPLRLNDADKNSITRGPEIGAKTRHRTTDADLSQAYVCHSAFSLLAK